MAFFNKKVEMTLHTLPAFISNYSNIVWLIVNVFNVYGHLLCYSVTYCVDEGQSPVTSRQFGPSDSQNRYTTSLFSPDCVTVLCYTSLLSKEVDLVDNFIGLSYNEGCVLSFCEQNTKEWREGISIKFCGSIIYQRFSFSSLILTWRAFGWQELVPLMPEDYSGTNLN